MVHCTGIAVFCHHDRVLLVCFLLLFVFFLQGCRAEMSQFSPPFLPLARQSVASAGGDAHVGGKWMIPLRL